MCDFAERQPAGQTGLKNFDYKRNRPGLEKRFSEATAFGIAIHAG